jgi:hypothetical protein
MRKIITAAAVSAATLAVLAGTVACQGTAISKAAASKPASTSAASAPVSSMPAPATTPTDVTTGPVGTTFTATSTDSSGNTDSYDVTLVKVIDPATGADQFTTPDAGKHFVGTVFTITGDTGSTNDDANSDAVVIGSDGQTYTFDANDIAGYTNFNYGNFTVSAGRHATGAVVFQLPNGVKVASVQWNPNTFTTSSPATWNVS